MAIEPRASSGRVDHGHKTTERGWKLSVQGGYKPTASAQDVVASPPKGGSGIKAPPPRQ